MQTLLHDATRAIQMIDALERDGLDVDSLLAEVGVRRNTLQGDHPILPFATIAALFEKAAVLAGDDLLGLHHGQLGTVQGAGLIGYLGQSAPTVREIFRNLARYRRVVSDAIEIDASTLDRNGCLIWHYNIPANTTCRQLVEFNAVVTTAAVRAFTGRNFAPIDVSYAHPRRSGIRDFERFFGCPVTFGAPNNRMRFSPETLAIPVLTADSGLGRILTLYCDEILKKKERIGPTFTARVEQELANRLSTGEARQDVVAKSLGVSARTLARKLADEETTFQRTLEGVREALARSYLTDSAMPLTEIAFLLGYTDASSFSTAFRRWTGASPREYRARA